jgi:hypothetical protein
MAHVRKDFGFTAVRIEGGILPPEYLQTINALEAKKQANTDYGLTKSLALRDEIGRYWRMATDLWNDYKQRRARSDLDATKLTVEEWLRPLFANILGYHDITSVDPVTIGGRRFPIGYRACSGTVPLILTGHVFDLDRADSRFGDNGRRRPPYGLLQEYLNADDACLWGIVCNGNLIRLVRDNPSLTRPAFIEADVERMFEEQLFAAFAAFWLTFHVSRVAPREGIPSGCVLETWRTASIETGERAREKLRDGVTIALRQFGNGFLEHPANEALRKALSQGELTKDAYFQELLRLVYRLLFLFTAEDRDLLLHPSASDEARRLFAEGYSASRLRDRAVKRRHYDQHGDLWDGLKVAFAGLARGAVPLGLPALGGLFAADHCPHLDFSAITNDRLLQAIRALTFFASGKALARVNYRDMGTEELGSVYESLLELRPIVDAAPWKFGFIGDNQEGRARGSERKLTGSYYTPPALVNELIKSALVPVIERTLKDNPGKPREALLALNIVDPACGSGHFLLAAARRVAAEIARLDAGPDTPGEYLRQHALRQVVQHCIYGVDRNPLAVELCKTALWIETVERGKPLSFLDAHIRCGDSLTGIFDLSALHVGIPDEAYKALTGDARQAAACHRKKNAEEIKERKARETRGSGLDLTASPRDLALALEALEAMPEDSVADIEAKRRSFESIRSGNLGWRMKIACDLWCAAFFMPKTEIPPRGRERVPTSGQVWQYLDGITLYGPLVAEADWIAAQARFFHWPIEFPDVFARGGFDVALGNPPWERIKLQEQEFFASRSAEIAAAPNKAARERLISALKGPKATPVEQTLHRAFEDARHEAEAASQFIRTGRGYPLTGVGDINTYAVFAETFLKLIAPKGRAGFIVPTGIATDNTTKAFFEEISTQGRLVSLIDFENREKIFAAVDSRMKFCLLTLGLDVPEAEFVFFATNITQLTDKRRRFVLSPADILRINPNTKTAPVFRSNADAELTKKIYARVPVLIDEAKGAAGNPWGISFTAMFHMSNDSGLFRTFAQLTDADARTEGVKWIAPDGQAWVPLYEAKMIHQFDHRWATYEADGESARDVTTSEKKRRDFEPLPRYWVPEREVEDRMRAKGWNRGWLMGWRDITNATNERTVIATAFPRVGVGHTLPLFFLDAVASPKLWVAHIGNWCALTFDFFGRQKIGGTHLTYSYLKQFPTLSPSAYGAADLDFIVPRVLELTYTSQAMRPFAEDLGYQGSPFPWDDDRRALLRAELDAYYARLYDLTRDELRYILDPADVYGEDYPSETFRVLKKSEIREYGEYRTRRLVLQAWDRLEAKTLDWVAA